MIARVDFPTLEWEKNLWGAGLRHLAGVDEAGRGALAGPVAAAAVILPANEMLPRALAGVRDSKQMSPAERTFWTPRIQAVCVAWGIGLASVEEIDELGIVPATCLAAQRALENLTTPPDILLTDYLLLRDLNLPQIALVKGDQRCLSIAAASILAKTYRDALLSRLDQDYPGYGFARHKGYGTSAHRAAIRRLGLCPLHRRSFACLPAQGIANASPIQPP